VLHNNLALAVQHRPRETRILEEAQALAEALEHAGHSDYEASRTPGLADLLRPRFCTSQLRPAPAPLAINFILLNNHASHCSPTSFTEPVRAGPPCLHL